MIPWLPGLGVPPEPGAPDSPAPPNPDSTEERPNRGGDDGPDAPESDGGANALEADGDAVPLDEPRSSETWADDSELLAARDLDDWKDALRGDFEAWLETLDAIPDDDVNGDAEIDRDPPDLLAFYAQLAAAGAESRKANRRTAEAFSQWSETLTRFEEDLRQLRGQLFRLNESAERAAAVPRDFCLALVDLQDRLGRLGQAFRQTPASTWWRNDGSWRQAWATQRQGFEILSSHSQALLERAGVTAFESVGQRFDPTRMVAAATETTAARPHHTVLEELLPGYLFNAEVLRPAQVKVSIQPT